MSYMRKIMLPKIDRNSLKYGVILGSLLALATYFGHEVWETAGINAFFVSAEAFVTHLICLLGLMVVVCCISVLAIHYIVTYQMPTSEKYSAILQKRSTWVLLWGIMVASYLLCYVAYYPGIFSYDIYIQYVQAGGWAPYSNHQPIFHTLLWKVFYTIELKCKREGLGIILFSLTQICIMSTIFTYSIYFMAKRKLQHWILLLLYLFYVAMPTLAIFVLVPTKDVPFSGAMILFTLALIELCEKKRNFFEDKRQVEMLMISAILCCLFRNNGIYVVLLIGIIVVVKYPKQGVLCFATIILLYSIILNLIFFNIDVNESPVHEKLSIPITQIANVYMNQRESLSEKEKQLILAYIPTVENYNPSFADRVKDDFDDERFIKNKGEFIGLWWNLFLREPLCYINAFLSLNINFWYPGATYPDPYTDCQYIETRRWEGNSVKVDVPFPALHDFYEGFAQYEYSFMKWPIVSFLFSICSATVVWVILLFCTLAKRGGMILPFLTVGFLMLTYMAGPTSTFRYVYTALVLLPIYWGMVLQPSKM